MNKFGFFELRFLKTPSSVHFNDRLGGRGGVNLILPFLGRGKIPGKLIEFYQIPFLEKKFKSLGVGRLGTIM